MNSVTCFFGRGEHADGLSLSINCNTRFIRLRSVWATLIEVDAGR